MLYWNHAEKDGETNMFTMKAVVKVKNDKGVVIAQQEYDKVVFEGIALLEGKVVTGDNIEQLLGDAIALLQKEAGEDGNGVVEMLKNVTYAHDLGVRASIRQSLVTALEGPDKAIDKSVKNFMAARAAAGKPISEEAARKKVMAMMADED
jgi:hypothetical protein